MSRRMTQVTRHHPVLPCGWCGTPTSDPTQTNCKNCGGPLPPSGALALDDPGPKPPSAPRKLPAAYKRQVMLWKNVHVFIGVLFTVVFCWTILFPLIGIPLWIVGHRRGKQKLLALEQGRPGRAELQEVFRDTSVTINNRHPWRVVYSFEDQHGTVHDGDALTWSAAHSRREAGEAFWVVYMPNEPEINAPWPPLR